MKKLSKYTRLSIILIIICGIAVFLVTFRLSSVTIRNDSIYSDDELRNRFFDNKRLDHNTLLFVWKINHSSKYRIPFIEKVDAEVKDNNSCIVYVYGKVVIGCVEHMGQYMHFDREGIVVESSDEPLSGMPLITGLKFEKVVKGSRLSMGDSDLFERLLALIMKLKQCGLKTDEISFGIRDDVTLHIGGDEVLLGTDGDFDYRINNLPAVMEAVENSRGEGRYRYDMRYYSEKNQEISAKKLE